MRKYSVTFLVSTLNIDVSTAKTVKGLIEGLIDPESFESVERWVSQCYNKPNDVELRLTAINEVLECYGVEAITSEDWTDSYHCNIRASYCNSGDSYVPTVIRCHKDKKFIVGCIADYIEKAGL